MLNPGPNRLGKSIGAVYFGTDTVTVLGEDTFPEESVAWMRIEYTRPRPLPERSARKLTVWSPVMSQSVEVWPSPAPSADSLLRTSIILHVAAPQAVDASAFTVIATIL